MKGFGAVIVAALTAAVAAETCLDGNCDIQPILMNSSQAISESDKVYVISDTTLDDGSESGDDEYEYRSISREDDALFEEGFSELRPQYAGGKFRKTADLIYGALKSPVHLSEMYQKKPEVRDVPEKSSSESGNDEYRSESQVDGPLFEKGSSEPRPIYGFKLKKIVGSICEFLRSPVHLSDPRDVSEDNSSVSGNDEYRSESQVDGPLFEKKSSEPRPQRSWPLVFGLLFDRFLQRIGSPANLPNVSHAPEDSSSKIGNPEYRSESRVDSFIFAERLSKPRPQRNWPLVIGLLINRILPNPEARSDVTRDASPRDDAGFADEKKNTLMKQKATET